MQKQYDMNSAVVKKATKLVKNPIVSKVVKATYTSAINTPSVLYNIGLSMAIAKDNGEKWDESNNGVLDHFKNDIAATTTWAKTIKSVDGKNLHDAAVMISHELADILRMSRKVARNDKQLKHLGGMGYVLGLRDERIAVRMDNLTQHLPTVDVESVLHKLVPAPKGFISGTVQAAVISEIAELMEEMMSI